MFNIVRLLGPVTGITVGKPSKAIFTSGPSMFAQTPVMRIPAKSMDGLILEITFDPRTATLAHCCLTRNKILLNTGKAEITVAYLKDGESEPETFILKPAECEAIPSGVWHAIINASDETAIVAVVNDRPPEPGDVKWEDDPPNDQPTIPEVARSEPLDPVTPQVQTC